jgi:hypothetical protein
MNLVDWPLQEAFEADPDGGGVTCVSWGTARYAPPMLAVGCFSGSLALWRHAAGSKWKVCYVTLHYITASRSGGTATWKGVEGALACRADPACPGNWAASPLRFTTRKVRL